MVSLWSETVLQRVLPPVISKEKVIHYLFSTTVTRRIHFCLCTAPWYLSCIMPDIQKYCENTEQVAIFMK